MESKVSPMASPAVDFLTTYQHYSFISIFAVHHNQLDNLQNKKQRLMSTVQDTKHRKKMAE
jgi:hypothetical protein